MNQLSLNDRRHVEAAKGWCELHSFADAYAELEQVTPAMRSHPDVLEVRWQVYANLDKWEGALDLANAIRILVPDSPKGHIYTASSLRELGRVDEALRTVRMAAESATNLLLPMRESLRAGATLGQIANTLRAEFSEYRAVS